MMVQTFKNRKVAKKELETMQGWNAKVGRLYLPDNENANRNGNVFVIECHEGTSQVQYLHDDGYVKHGIR